MECFKIGGRVGAAGQVERRGGRVGGTLKLMGGGSWDRGRLLSSRMSEAGAVGWVGGVGGWCGGGGGGGGGEGVGGECGGGGGGGGGSSSCWGKGRRAEVVA